jgi:class 3 adenylate cyclase/pimeloyl-ACP methyl ester carboxylesterase
MDRAPGSLTLTNDRHLLLSCAAQGELGRMVREVRYCTTEDGVRLAYCVEGEGPPLVVAPSFIESLELADESPELARFFRELLVGRRLIRYDARGSGLSQREASELTETGYVYDIQAVAKAAKLDRFALFGSGQTGGSAIAYASLYPDRVSAVILHGTTTGRAMFGAPEPYRALAEFARSNWEAAASVFVDPSIRDAEPEVATRWARVLSRTRDGDLTARFMLANIEYDITHYAIGVRARTLVLHRMGDTRVPFDSAKRLATLIRRARLVPLQGEASHYCLGDYGAVLNAMNAFLDEEPESRRVGTTRPAGGSTSLRTVLFTDLVGHTEMMSRLGDERGRAVLREYEQITREVLRAHGGTEVKALGDGFMASFRSVARAVECAIALQRAFSEREGEPLAIRVGLNAGEPIEEEGDLFGATVILASRIAAKAEGAEILVADTVRGLSSGKGFLFADRGEFAAKGFEEPVRVYEVRWRDG